MADDIVESRAAEGVMRAWTRKCSLRAQAVLCAAIRGCDGLSKTDPSKSVVWALRYDVLNPSCGPGHDNPSGFTAFMGYKSTLEEDTEAFLGDLDPYPFHFVRHLAHAAHILSIYHDRPEIADRWRKIYEGIVVEGFHARPEDDMVMKHRLRDR